MGIINLLLKKGRGVNMLNLGTEHELNISIIKVVKELDELDKTMNQLRAGKEYAKLLSCAGRQLSLINQLENYSMVRLLRIEDDYKNISGTLKVAHAHYNQKNKHLQNEKKKLKEAIKSGHNITEAQEKLAHANREMKTFYSKIIQMKSTISSLRSTIRHSCKKKLIKIKKIYKNA